MGSNYWFTNGPNHPGLVRIAPNKQLEKSLSKPTNFKRYGFISILQR